MSWKHFWRANNKKNDWTWKKEERTKERRKKHNERLKQTHREKSTNVQRRENASTFFCHAFV